MKSRKQSILNPIDVQSACWQTLKKHIEQKIEKYRDANDRDQTPEKTAKLRGRIAELKSLLIAVEPKQYEFEPPEKFD